MCKSPCPWTSQGWWPAVKAPDLVDPADGPFREVEVAGLQTVEVGDHACAVVLRDEGRDLRRQVVLVGEVEAIAYVVGDDAGTVGGVEGVMRVGAAELVLDKEAGARKLTDVVVIAADAGQEGVATDGDGALFGEVGDDDAVLEGGGRLVLQSKEQGLAEL